MNYIYIQSKSYPQCYVSYTNVPIGYSSTNSVHQQNVQELLEYNDDGKNLIRDLQLSKNASELLAWLKERNLLTPDRNNSNYCTRKTICHMFWLKSLLYFYIMKFSSNMDKQFARKFK